MGSILQLVFRFHGTIDSGVEDLGQEPTMKKN
jgi:hypothetical protein